MLMLMAMTAAAVLRGLGGGAAVPSPLTVRQRLSEHKNCEAECCGRAPSHPEGRTGLDGRTGHASCLQVAAMDRGEMSTQPPSRATVRRHVVVCTGEGDDKVECQVVVDGMQNGVR